MLPGKNPQKIGLLDKILQPPANYDSGKQSTRVILNLCSNREYGDVWQAALVSP